MIDYELNTYAVAVMSNFLSGITIYFSIVTAYAVAAFVAGEKLTKLQLAIVNVSFTIAAGIMGILSVLFFSRFVELAKLAQETQIAVETPLVDFTYPLGVLVAAVYLGCLVFMWSIRRKSDDV